MDREELAWAAGFLDGEGHFSLSSRDLIPRVKIDQKEPELLLRFRDAVGIGKVFERPQSNGMYTYQVWKFKETLAVGALLWFKLGTYRRKQFAAAIHGYLAADIVRR